MLTTAIKNQTHCLTDDVEKWLKHNKPTLLAHGESFGEVKAITKPVVKVSAVEQKRAIRAQLKQKQADEREEAKRLRKSKIDKQADVIGDFYDRATRKDIKNLCAMVGITGNDLRCAMESRLLDEDTMNAIKAALVDFQWFTPPKPKKKPAKKKTKEQQSRYKALAIAKQNAIDEGKGKFTAPCKHHGMTEYALIGARRVRCEACFEAAKFKCKVPNDGDRRRLNAVKMENAVQAGLKFFIGTCAHHSESTYAVRKKHKDSNDLTYICLCCERISKDKSNAVQREKRKMRKLK